MLEPAGAAPLLCLCEQSQPSAGSHPARVHFHVPLGPDHVVLVGGHGDPGPGTEAGVSRPQGPEGEERRYKHGRRQALRVEATHFSSPVSCFSRSLRGVCPPELQTRRRTASVGEPARPTPLRPTQHAAPHTPGEAEGSRRSAGKPSAACVRVR